MGFSLCVASPSDPGNLCSSVFTRVYLVHKASGLAYNANDALNISTLSLGSSPNFFILQPDSLSRTVYDFRRDQSGNLYATYEVHSQPDCAQFITNTGEPIVPTCDEITLGNRLIKIDTSSLGSGPLTAEVLPFLDGHLRTWEVSPDGSFVVYSSGDSGSISRFLNVSSGALSNLHTEIPETFSGKFWARALDGRIYGPTKSTATQVTSSMYRIEMDVDGGPKAVLIGSITSDAFGPQGEKWPGANAIRRVVGGKILFLDTSVIGSTIEVQPETATFINHPAPSTLLSGITAFGTTADFVFYLGVEVATSVDAILRYNPATGDTLLFNNIADFDISRFKIMSNNKVWFTALRLSDQATVAGEIDVAGTVTITDVKAANEPGIILMVPINVGDFLSVDGSAQEWPLNLRLLNDVVGDHTVATNGDLIAYSQQMSASTYTALVGFNGTISTDIEVEVVLSTAWAVKITRSGAFLLDRLAVTESPLNGAGGLFAIGEAVEFSVPLSAIGSPVSVSPTVTARDLVDDGTGTGTMVLTVVDQMP